MLILKIYQQVHCQSRSTLLYVVTYIPSAPKYQYPTFLSVYASKTCIHVIRREFIEHRGGIV